jgi:carbon-monoxide dehydrogenase large subunit
MNSIPAQGSVGKRLPRREDTRLTMGQGLFVADIPTPDALHIHFVRSTHSHARILNINTLEAKKIPGVVAVITGADIEDKIQPLPHPVVVPNLPGRFPKHWSLAVGKVRYHGEPLAVIVATSKYIAEDAAELVEVEYQELPYVGSPEAADAPSAPRIHEEWPDNEIFSMSFTGGATAESIAANQTEVEAIFATAPHRIARRFKTHRTGITPLETRGMIATWSESEGLTCHLTTQRPHIDRLALAKILEIPTSKVRIIAPRDQGGGFGTRAPFYREPILIAYLAKTLGRTVRWIESREEGLMVIGQERDQVHELEMAAQADGRVLAVRARITADNGDGCQGVYWGFVMPFLGAALLASGYDFPKCDIHMRSVVTNKPSLSPSRSFGAFPGRFAIERLLDLLARQLKIDPLDIRRINLVKDLPYTTATGLFLDSGNYPAVLESLAKTINYDDFRLEQSKALQQGRYIGIGFGLGAELSGVASDVMVTLENQPGYGAATVRIDAAGEIQILEGDAPTGTGHETSFAQVASQILGVDPVKIRLVTGDTANTPFGSGAIGARGGSYTVSAVARACKVLRDKIAITLAHDLKIDARPEDFEFSDELIYLKADPSISRTMPQMAERLIMKPVNMPPGIQAGLEATDYFEAATPMMSFSAHVCTVEVNVQTGEFKIQRYVTCEDAGTIINPLIVEGQIQGGVIQGLSNAMFEEFIYDENGQQLTSNLEAYKIAIAPDVPNVEVTHMSTWCPGTPLGSRGLGEGVPGPVPGALVNAICDALRPFGIEINQLPVRPDKIWSSIQAAQASRKSNS